jgi:heme exporter protein D
MHFNSFAEMIHMGGYAVYVWSSVFIVIAVLAFLIVHSVTAKKRTLTMLRLEQERADKIAQAKLVAEQARSQA